MMEQHEEEPVEMLQRSCFVTEKNRHKMNFKIPISLIYVTFSSFALLATTVIAFSGCGTEKAGTPG